MSAWTFDTIVDLLDRYHQRATYGAVGGVLGVPATVVMFRKPYDARHSWVVNQKTGKPTGFPSEALHPKLYARAEILKDAASLREWLEARRRLVFLLEYWEDDGWFVGRLKGVSGVFSQGQTLTELEDNIREAYQLMRGDEEPAPKGAQIKELVLES
jgi:predicted RNase H-like HicB family nuclease